MIYRTRVEYNKLRKDMRDIEKRMEKNKDFKKLLKVRLEDRNIPLWSRKISKSHFKTVTAWLKRDECKLISLHKEKNNVLNLKFLYRVS